MIKVNEMTNDEFRVCMETISRMGVIKKSVKEADKKYFYQSCYIVKIHGEYYVAYFKEIMNKKMEELDFARMNTIALLLEKWKIAVITDKSVIDEYGSLPSVFVVPYKDKNKFEKRNKISSKQMSNFIQIQIKKMEVEKSIETASNGEKIN